MKLRSKMTKSIVLAGIPLLTLPLLAESGMSRDRSQRDDGGRSQSNEQIIQGEISKKKGDEITLRTRDGERITFRINDQTNQLCPKGMASQTSQTSQSSSMGQGSSGQSQMTQGSSDQEASDSGQTSSSSLFGSSSGQTSGQTSSGKQSSSQQAGFKFGECNFHNGEFVKARVDENGDANFVRSLGQKDDNYFSAGREGDDYFVLPAGEMGGLDISDKDSHYSVKSSDGEKIGEVHRIMTSGNGDLSYAIIKKKDGQLFSVPWQALEGQGNRTFKLKVTQDQLGNLPIMEEGESAGTHVQKHWDLTGDERQRLAKWDDRLDNFYQERDRYTEDTPTFSGNRKGYDRYDYDQSRQSRMNRSGGDRSPTQPRFQDQSFDDSQVKHYGWSPSEFPPPSRAPSYEGADRQGSFDRNRGDQRSMYSQGRTRNYGGDRYPTQPRYQDQSFDDSQVKHYGWSPSEFPPPSRAPSYEGNDRQGSFDRNRQGRSSDDYRNRGDQQSRYSSPYYDRSQLRSKRGNYGEQQGSMYSQSREGNYEDPMEGLSDRYNTTTRRSKYDPQRQGSDQNQSRRSGGSDYDYRPEGYRP